jgi:hypothetical protein
VDDPYRGGWDNSIRGDAMQWRMVAAAAIVGAVCGGWFFRAVKAAQNTEKAGKAATKAAPKATDKTAATDAAQEPVAVRYARAQLRLAELTLRKARELNRKVPLTIPNPMMAQFADDVTYAKAQLQVAERSKGADVYGSWVERAEVTVRTAEAKLKQASEVDRAVPGTFEPIDMDRFRLGVEIAKLQLERGRSLANASPEDRMQWQLEVLGDGMARLKEQIWLISQNRGPLEF